LFIRNPLMQPTHVETLVGCDNAEKCRGTGWHHPKCAGLDGPASVEVEWYCLMCVATEPLLRVENWSDDNYGGKYVPGQGQTCVPLSSLHTCCASLVPNEGDAPLWRMGPPPAGDTPDTAGAATAAASGGSANKRARARGAAEAQAPSGHARPTVGTPPPRTDPFQVSAPRHAPCQQRRLRHPACHACHLQRG